MRPLGCVVVRVGVLIYRMEFMSGWRYSEELLASISGYDGRSGMAVDE